MEILPLGANQLYLSGNFGKKIFESLRDKKVPHPFLKACFQFDGAEMNVDGDNKVTFFGFFDTSYLLEFMEKIDDYIKKKIDMVKDEEMKKKVITIANSPVSRFSRFHILNIEILVAAALNKTDRFETLFYLMKDKDVYEFTKDNYEFYVFSIYDAGSKEKVIKISDALMEEANEVAYEDNGYVAKRRDLTSMQDEERNLRQRVVNCLSDDALENVKKNLQLIKI